MSSLRTGKGALSIKQPSPAKLRAMGRRGNETMANRNYSETVPF